jgi:hypothetical protein
MPCLHLGDIGENCGDKKTGGKGMMGSLFLFSFLYFSSCLVFTSSFVVIFHLGAMLHQKKCSLGINNSSFLLTTVSSEEEDLRRGNVFSWSEA